MEAPNWVLCCENTCDIFVKAEDRKVEKGRPARQPPSLTKDDTQDCKSNGLTWCVQTDVSIVPHFHPARHPHAHHTPTCLFP